MNTRRLRSPISLAMTVAVLGACASKATILHLDHTAGTASLLRAEKGPDDAKDPAEWAPETIEDDLRSGATIRVAHQDDFIVWVTNTTTALNTYSARGDTVSVPEVSSLATALGQLRPTLFDLLDTRSRLAETQTDLLALFNVVPPPDTTGPDPCADRDNDLLRDIGAVTNLGHDVSRASLTAAAMVAAVRQSPSRTEAEAAKLEQALRGLGIIWDRGTRRLKVDTFTGALSQLESTLSTSSSSSCPPTEETRNKALMVLSGGPALVSGVLALDDALRRLLRSRSYWRSDIDNGSPPPLGTPDLDVTLLRGMQLTVTAAHDAGTLTQNATPHTPFTFETRVLPAWHIKPVVGFALIRSPDASFPLYTTRPRMQDSTDTMLRIQANGTENRQWQWGLSLGIEFGLRKLGMGNRSWGVVFPEIVINPSDNVRGFGIGGGLRVRFVKVTAGWLWTKHTDLVPGLEPNGLIAAEGDLRTHSTYGNATGYLAVSLVGLPPFIN